MYEYLQDDPIFARARGITCEEKAQKTQLYCH